MPNGSNKLLSGVYRISDYLDKQAVREKEKKKERLLSVLPTYIEQQISGITDEKTLLSTVPKLSAELYQYGADVGSAASQILGNLAQTKYRELTLDKQTKQQTDTLEILGETYKGLTFDYGGNQNATMGDILDDLRGKGYTPDTIGSQIGNILKSTAFQETGQVTEKGGKTFYSEYSISPKGTVKAGTSFQINEDTQGRRTLDDLNTPNTTEQLPITPEVLEYYEGKDKFDRQLQKQFGLMEQREINARKRKIADVKLQTEAQRFYDKVSNEPVYAKFNPETFETTYYKKGKEQVITDISPTPFFKDTEIPVTDLSTIGKVGQQGRTGTDELTPSRIDQDVQDKNRTLQGIGEQILAAKVPEEGFGFTGAIDEEDIMDIDPRTGALSFYNRANIEDVVNKNPNHKITYLGQEMRLIDVWNIYLSLETKSQISTTGITPGVTSGQTPKLDYDKVK